MDFKTFVINLKRCTEKRKRMEDRLKGEEYEMTTAVDGKELNKDILKELDVEILKQWKDPWSGRNITWGEVGCTLSHYNIYKYCVENKIENAIILEDDINIPQNLSSILDNIIGNLNKEISSWELCYLSRKPMNSEKENINEFKDFVKAEYSYWTCSYIINLKGMQKIIDSNYHKNIIPADEVLPIVAQSSPYKDYYKYYNLQEPLKMYSLKNVSCRPEPDAFQKSDTDTGSPEVQIALLTENINKLQDHFKEHKKDHHSRTGLIRMVNLRRKLLAYLKRKDQESYLNTIKALKLRG